MQETAVVARPQSTLLRPVAGVGEILETRELISQMIIQTLKEGTDYGVIPGTKIPSLLKPGAEKLAASCGLIPRFRVVEKEIDHTFTHTFTKNRKVWNNKFSGDKSYTMVPEQCTVNGLYRYVIECELIKDGAVVGQCIASCSTMESKYIERASDCENTVLKMAEKRAFVGATLHAFALSDRFTQDKEDTKRRPVEEPKIVDYTQPKPSRADVEIYNDDDAGMQDRLVAKLDKIGVPKDHYPRVGELMNGKAMTSAMLMECITEAAK